MTISMTRRLIGASMLAGALGVTVVGVVAPATASADRTKVVCVKHSCRGGDGGTTGSANGGNANGGNANGGEQTVIIKHSANDSGGITVTGGGGVAGNGGDASGGSTGNANGGAGVSVNQ